MIIPYSTEVVITRWPVGNLLLIAACLAGFALELTVGMDHRFLQAMVLSGWHFSGLIGYQFLHAGVAHLVFNLLYLWVFGNAVCEKIGSFAYVGVYLLSGVLAGMAQILFDGTPAIGASGAINGMIGFYLVLYPVNRVNCFYWILRPGTFDIRGFWLILFWVLVDLFTAFSGTQTGLAAWAHVGGFVAGLGLGVVYLLAGWARMADYDNPTLLDYLSGAHRRRAGLTYEKQSFRPTPAGERGAVRSARPPVRPPARAEPEPPALSIHCPHCSQALDIPAELIGKKIQCPACHGEIALEAG
jgi:membrane associated rhomboid family serine protease